MILLFQSSQNIDDEKAQILAILFLLFVALLFIRNFWNWLMKRSYRSKYRRLLKAHEEVTPKIDALNLNQTKLLSEKEQLEYQIDKLKHESVTIKNSFKEKEKELKSKRISEREAYEKKLDDFKYERIFYKESLQKTEVKASNTRLSAHFLKNVLFKIQESYKKQNIDKIHVFGNLFFIQKENKSELLPIDVLTKINKLLDYNVATVKEPKVSLSKEVENIKLFIDIIKFLKPNVKITHNFKTKYKFNISPTLFFPFLENALKHGNLNDKNSFINIELIIIKNTLLYKVTNSSYNVKNKPFEKGFGLESLEKALNTYYKTSELDFTSNKNEFISELTVELE